MNELIIGVMLIGGLLFVTGFVYPVCMVVWEKVIHRSGKTVSEIIEEL